jgi:hypothetical protein
MYLSHNPETQDKDGVTISDGCSFQSLDNTGNRLISDGCSFQSLDNTGNRLNKRSLFKGYIFWKQEGISQDICLWNESEF